jgi:hypothetical protein
VCAYDHCYNGIEDIGEDDVDCGGSDCVECPCPNPDGNGTSDYCQLYCKCSAGEGDCDKNTHCIEGLICGPDLGPNFGMPANYDVCVSPHCTNDIQDEDESGIDCGGLDCGICP